VPPTTPVALGDDTGRDVALDPRDHHQDDQ
jgi:hypothetical protein